MVLPIAHYQPPTTMTNHQSAEQLLELATKAGAEAAEVLESQSLSRPFFLKQTASNS